MHHYPHHIGDYSKDTPGLTMAEHGAYRLLMDAYYASEAAIPADEVYAIAKAADAAGRRAVDKVLRKFFVLDGAVYRQKRIDEEIAKYLEKVDLNRENGKLGGRPPKEPKPNPEKTQTVSEKEPRQEPRTNPEITLTSNQEPITKEPKPLRVVSDTAFDRFWTSWPASPRKVARAKCAEIWKRRSLGAEVDAIVAHVQVMKNSEQWRSGFEPAPLTYLNQRRWEDGETKPALPRYT